MKRPLQFLFVFNLLVLVLMLSGTATAQIETRELTFDPPQRLAASTPESYARLGWDVAIEGDTLILGGNSYGYPIMGKVYVYVRSGDSWIEQATLQASDAKTNDQFGASIALNGNTALIGAPLAQAGSSTYGAVYAFVRNGTSWTQQAKLLPDTIDAPYFGEAVALDGNTAIVGRKWGGSAYIFVRNGNSWTQQAKLTSPETGIPIEFGASVAISGNTALIGTVDGNPSYSPETPPEGVAYVYVRNGTTWTKQAKLMASDGQRHNHFSYSLTLQGDTALIGAPHASNGGKAYAFVRQGNTWVEQFIFRSTGTGILFGSGVALDGNTAVIGNMQDSGLAGAAYVFYRSGNNWIQQTRLTKPDSQAADYFGWSLGLSGNTLVAGAITEPYNQQPVYLPAVGAAYVFEFEGTPELDLELLVNGGFEMDSDQNKVPDGWSRKNTTKDERRCNKPNEAPIAYSGNCAYFMKGGSPTGGKLVQNANLSQFNLKAGDTVRLNGFYNKQSTGPVFVYLFVNYANFPDEERRIVLRKTTTGYQPVNQSSITLKAAPLRVRVELVNETTSGKTWFDAMSLTATTGGQVQTLDLPLTLDEQSQTESLIPLP
jgi:hypothetical protein